MGLGVTRVVGRFKAPTLVLYYDFEPFCPGQSRQMYDLLHTRREYVALMKAIGAQWLCSPMAFIRAAVLDCLADDLQR
jgi:hypothetical protein